MQKGRRDMRKFDYSFLNNGLLPANLVNLTSNIASLKTMAGVRKEEHQAVFTELEAVAKIQSIKSSNAIEGIVTSDERIAAIVNQNNAPLNHNEAEIAGYRDALNAIHLGYDTIDFREADILHLHEMMMLIAGYEYGGQYKTDDNVILEVDATETGECGFVLHRLLKRSKPWSSWNLHIWRQEMTRASISFF
jgi:Fic family protein